MGAFGHYRVNICSYSYFVVTSYLHLCTFLQGGNARIDNSGSLLREEDDGEFIVLIEVDTGNALGVRGFKIVPDTPIIASSKSGSINQLWKYSTPMAFVSINYYTALTQHYAPFDYKPSPLVFA